jgi:hypothetical protein
VNLIEDAIAAISDPVDRETIPARLLAAASYRKTPWALLVNLYAYAIVTHGTDGSVDWSAVNAAVGKDHWMPGRADVLKAHAWRTIRKARAASPVAVG